MKPFWLSSGLAPARRWASRAGIVRLLLGATLCAVLLALVDRRRLWATIARVDGFLLGAALVAAFGAIVLLEAWRFRVAFSGWLSFAVALRVTLAGLFVGSFTPGAVGADIYKLYAVRRHERRMARPFVKLVLLRLVGASAVVAVAAVALLAAPGRAGEIAGQLAWRWPAGAVPVLVISGAVLGTLALVIFYVGREWFAPRLRETWLQGREGLAEVTPRQLGELFVLSLGIALLRGLSLALLVRSLGETARFGDLLVVVAFSVFAGTLPISPAGLGVQEGVLAGCLVLLHVPPPDAVAAAFLNRAFLWLFAAGGGWALAAARPEPPPPSADQP